MRKIPPRKEKFSASDEIDIFVVSLSDAIDPRAHTILLVPGV